MVFKKREVKIYAVTERIRATIRENMASMEPKERCNTQKKLQKHGKLRKRVGTKLIVMVVS